MIFHVCFLIHPFFWKATEGVFEAILIRSLPSTYLLVAPSQVKDILRTGNDIMVAGYCMYGAATELVITFQGARLPSLMAEFPLSPKNKPSISPRDVEKARELWDKQHTNGACRTAPPRIG